MGLFSRRKPAPPPVDNTRVRNLLKLGMKETEQADRGEDTRAFQQAKAAFDAELGKATPAEKAAAFDALKRHGY